MSFSFKKEADVGMWWGWVMRISKWPVLRLLNKNVNFYEAAIHEGLLTFSLVRDT